MSTTTLKQNMDMECGGFTFFSSFDSSNIDHVELVPLSEKTELLQEEDEIPDYEFNIWVKADCAGTEFENNYKTWFYFGVKGGAPHSVVRLNILNLNMQGKLYRQGMKPVYKVPLGNNRWEQIDDTPIFGIRENLFSLRFDYRPLNDLCNTTYFAFTYPYSYADMQNTLTENETQLRKQSFNGDEKDRIYYHRECLIKSLDGLPVDLITITSHHGITFDREQRLTGLFPDTDLPRPFIFKGKKVIFLSARVHPGETPSSFVMNGLMKFLLNKTNAAAVALRKLYVFKLIPMLNPDGVSRGYYRTDTKGNNLNRFYCNPSRTLQPAIYAARSLILYYHYGQEVTDFDDILESSTTIKFPNYCLDKTKPKMNTKNSTNKNAESAGLLRVFTSGLDKLKVKFNRLQASSSSRDSEKESCDSNDVTKLSKEGTTRNKSNEILSDEEETCKSNKKRMNKKNKATQHTKDSGLFLYVDFHAHASKKGIFMYGNYFEHIAEKVECLLLPKLLSINNQHFHYNSCNFTKSNMFQRGKRDGLSKEGCGRVAVLKFTGLVKSYTLECNYNTGHFVNVIPPTQRPTRKRSVSQLLVPPKYSPHIFEEVGKALCISILDLTGNNPNSRIVNSQYRNINGLREHLKSEVTSERNLFKCRFSHRSPSTKRFRKDKMLNMIKSPRMPKKKSLFSENNNTSVKKDTISTATSTAEFTLKECSSKLEQNTIDYTDRIETRSCATSTSIVRNRKVKRKLEKTNRENDTNKEKVNESSCKHGKNIICLKKRMKK